MKASTISLLLCVVFLCTLLASCEIDFFNINSSPVVSSAIAVESENGESEIKEPSSEIQSDKKQNTNFASSQIKDNSSKNNTSVNSNKPQQNSGSTSSQKPNSGSSSKPQTSNSTSSQKPIQNVSQTPLKPIDSSQYYAWQQLKKSGTQAEQKAYQLFAKEFGNYKTTVTFDFKITAKEVEKSLEHYRDDYSQHFWIGNYSYTTVGSNVTELTLKDMMFGGNTDTIKSCEKQMLSKAKQILSKLSGSMTDIEKERIIHDYLVNNIKYDRSYNAPNSHDIYGALVNGTAVCEGYSNAFHYLMREAGVQCILVKGKLNGVSHEWNMVQLDGNYYHMDVTSDDPIVNNGTTHVLKFDYFNLTDADIKKSHTIEKNVYNVPTATKTSYNFFNYYGLKSNKISVDFVAKAMAFSVNKGYKHAHINLPGVNIEDAKNYIAENYFNIINKANGIIGTNKIKTDGYMYFSDNEKLNILSLMISY